MRHHDGFTLIEVLIVVTIIGILAAMATPRLMRARMVANEGAAIGTLRAISSSQVAFATTCASGSFATDLADLVKQPVTGGQSFIGPDLNVNGVQKSGYTFTLTKNLGAGVVDVLTPTCNNAAANRASAYFADAIPITPGVSGNRFFATDTPGTIYYTDGAPAIPNPIPPATFVLK
jgi:prepilin-type N-terminal cleavage/methylation domain-containing protein